MNSLFILLSPILKPTAYLDPGSGSMLIQMILGAVLGLGVATRIFWKNIKGWFNKNKSNAEAELDPTEILDDAVVQDAPEDITQK